MASLLREYVGVVVGVVELIATECGGGGIGRCEAAGGVDHVVGGDQGWNAASDVAAWSTNRVFMVGDNIWSKEEFESCELGNPIRVYTSGLDRVRLDGAGARYFSSGKLENCQNGLKLHVHVVSQVEAGGQAKQVRQVMDAQELAAGPEPSGSTYIITSLTLVLIGFALLCFMVL